MKRHLAVAITGASGAIYGIRLIEELLAAGCRLSLVISRAGFIVLKEECGLDWGGDAAAVNDQVRSRFGVGAARLTYYADDDFFSPLASGSATADALVVAPCSMGSLGRIAAGLSGTLLERAADVMLKEGRPLILLPRETPLSAIHLENMLKLARLGVKIVPAMPGFYGQPQTIADLVDFVVGRLLAQLEVEHTLASRWGEREA
jgi:4-hydroxy-3-polyprenylbenzoate decarboxylase